MLRGGVVFGDCEDAGSVELVTLMMDTIPCRCGEAEYVVAVCKRDERAWFEMRCVRCRRVRAVLE